MAERLLARTLAERGLGHEVRSAGTGAWDGAPASEGTYLVGLENQLDFSDHEARLLTRQLVDDADLVLTMSRSHLDRVAELGGAEKAHLLGVFAGRSGADAEVSDPFGADLPTYRHTFQELSALVADVADRIARETAGDQR